MTAPPSSQPRPNRYPGKCVVCGVDVAASRGHLYKGADERWHTLCSGEACYVAVYGESGSVRRWADSDLVVHMEHDAKALPLLRAIADWDAEEKTWRVLPGRGDRGLVVDVAGRLGLELPEGWADEPLPPPVAARVEKGRASGARPYQLEGIAWLALHKHACLADDQGLGKTFQVLHALPDGAGLLVVCPSVAKGVWQREISKWLPGRFDSIRVCKGRKSFRWPQSTRECVIINYDILPPLRSESRSKGVDKVGEPCGKPPVPVVVAADEAHAAKSYKAARTKRFRAVAGHGAHVWGMTGTPIQNRPQEIWGVLTSLKANPLSWTAFQRGFSAYKPQWGGMAFERDSTGAIIVQPGITELLRRTMLRRLKSDVAKDLPPKVYTEHLVELKPALLKALDLLEADYGAFLLRDELPPFEAMAAVRRLLASASLREAERLVTEFESTTTPLVVFSAHREPAETLGARDGWACIAGGLPAEERTRIEDAFQRGELRGVACTIQAAGVAITLTRASDVLFVDQSWNPADNLQAEDRCHRIGQTASSVNIINMVADHALTRHVAELLAQKQALIAETLHGRAEYEA